MTSQQIQDGGRPPCDTMSGRTSVWVGVRGVIVGYCPGGLCPGIYLNCVSMRWKLTEQCETDCPLGVKLAASCLTAVLALVAGLYLRYVELLYQRLVLDVPSEAAHIPTMTTHAVYNSSSWFLFENPDSIHYGRERLSRRWLLRWATLVSVGNRSTAAAGSKLRNTTWIHYICAIFTGLSTKVKMHLFRQLCPDIILYLVRATAVP